MGNDEEVSKIALRVLNCYVADESPAAVDVAALRKAALPSDGDTEPASLACHILERQLWLRRGPQ